MSVSSCERDKEVGEREIGTERSKAQDASSTTVPCARTKGSNE